MNKRINEMFEQAVAKFNAKHKYATVNVPVIVIENFAELIVKECIECGNGLVKHYIDTHSEQEQVLLLAAIADYSNEIKKHFGIKMNERIKEFAEQAGFVFTNDGQTIDWSSNYDAELDKFAELIADHAQKENEFKPDWLDFRNGRACGAEEERLACLELCEQAIKLNLETKDYISKTSSPMEGERIFIETAICIAAIKQAEKLATAIRARGEVK